MSLNQRNSSVLSKGRSTPFNPDDRDDDEYGGVIIDPEGLPSSENVFSSFIRLTLLGYHFIAEE